MTPERKQNPPIGEMGRATMPLISDGPNALPTRTQVQTGLIVAWKGEVIFGAAEYGACLEAGVEPQILCLPDDDDPFSFVLDQAEKSNHWDMTERVYRAYRLWELVQRCKKGQIQGACANLHKDKTPHDMDATQGAIAKGFKVSRRSMAHVVQVERYGAPEVCQAIADRVIRYSDASTIVAAPAGIQRRAIAMVREGPFVRGEKVTTARKALEHIREERERAADAAAREKNRAAAAQDGVQLHALTVTDLQQMTEPKSVDLILTYPPMDGDISRMPTGLDGFRGTRARRQRGHGSAGEWTGPGAGRPYPG